MKMQLHNNNKKIQLPTIEFTKTTSDLCLKDKDSPAMPPLKLGVLRLYSMRFCPFAHRLRLVAAAKNIQPEIININLAEKPTWFTALTEGVFPAAQFESEIVTGSLAASTYIDQRFLGGTPLQPPDVFNPVEEDEKLKFFDETFVPSFVKLLIVGAAWKKKPPQQQQQQQQYLFQQAQENFENDLVEVQSWLPTKNEEEGLEMTFLMLMIWPWIHRLPVLHALTGYTTDKVKFASLLLWSQRMKEAPIISSTSNPFHHELEYYQSYLQSTPNCDAGLQEESNQKILIS